MVDGGCGTWHVAGWQWVMARGAAAAHLQHSIWVTRPSNQPLQCCSAAAGACRGLITRRLPSLAQHIKCYQVFKYKNSFLLPLISFSAAFMELTCKQEHYLVASFTLLSMIRLHIIFVQSSLTISIWCNALGFVYRSVAVDGFGKLIAHFSLCCQCYGSGCSRFSGLPKTIHSRRSVNKA